ncbi:MAG: hypothetical protein JW880_08125 [Candidatus Thermoplasmatota archaeon]|nr:hypothetical protein [Candidatus Thermoplasmatota archaeon]
MAWKVDKMTAIWGIAFGFVATISGMFLLAAVSGGFLAEGFFLLVLFWIIVFVAVSRFVMRLRRR